MFAITSPIRLRNLSFLARTKSMSTKESSLFEGKVVEGITNLVIGAPDLNTLKMTSKIFQQASQHLSDHGNEALFQYGARTGCKQYLNELTEFLNQSYKSDYSVHADNLVLTCGATHGLQLAASTLLPPGQGIIFVENPTYFIALDILQDDLGHRPVPVRMESDGIDINALEDAIKLELLNKKGCDTKSPYWSMLYTIPTFHNPTGVLLSGLKAEKLIELASKYNILIFCDDVYNLLHYESEVSPKRLVAYDSKVSGNVISNGTFSKILGPGVRVGWMETSDKIHNWIANTGVLKSGGSVNNVMAGVVACAMQLGLQSDHVKHLRIVYKQRMRSVLKVLDSNLPKEFKCLKPQGGYFIWVSGPENWNALEFSKWCKTNYSVQTLAGSAATAFRNVETDQPVLKCSNAIRLSIAFYEMDQLEEAAHRLCNALQEFGRDT